MHQLVLRKSLTLELPHGEKAFSNKAINKLVVFQNSVRKYLFNKEINQSSIVIECVRNPKSITFCDIEMIKSGISRLKY